MSEDQRLTPAELELESAMGALRPAMPTVDLPAAVFRAGQRSTLRSRRAWQLAAGLLAAAAATLAIVRPQVRIEKQVVYVEIPAKIPPAPPEPDMTSPERAPATLQALPWLPKPSAERAEYVLLCQAVIERGLDALPVTRSSPSTPTRIGDVILQRGISGGRFNWLDDPSNGDAQ
jgi:hypothetical protein